MKNYYLISEFAKLRGININSLRYYEKLGLLKPAYIDSKTGYRYYSVEQLPLLNNIILCVQLGIPLKEMAGYMDEEGNLQSQKLLERGKVVAQKRIIEMQNNLKYIEMSLRNMEGYKAVRDKKGVYCRNIEERKVIVTDYYCGELEVKDVTSKIAEIYKIAQKKDFYPILPAGQIIELDKLGQIKIQFFLEILNCSKEYDRVKLLPAGRYTCTQVVLNSETDLKKLIRRNWEEDEIQIIIDNVILEKHSLETRPSELQRLESVV